MKTFDEQWRPIKGYEGLYEVSSLGRVKSLKYGKILKPGNNGYGYLFVILCRNGKQKFLLVHRLVAEAFLPNPEGFEQVNHRDEDKTNNCVENLEFCNAKYNNNYGTRNKRISYTMTNNPVRSKSVEASRFSDFRTIELRFASTQEAERNGYFSGNVSSCCNGRFCREGNNKYKGLFWRFAS